MTASFPLFLRVFIRKPLMKQRGMTFARMSCALGYSQKNGSVMRLNRPGHMTVDGINEYLALLDYKLVAVPADTPVVLNRDFLIDA